MNCRCGHKLLAHTSTGRCILCSCSGFIDIDNVQATKGQSSLAPVWVIRADPDIRVYVRQKQAIGVSWRIPVDVSAISDPAEMFEFFQSQSHLADEPDARQRSTAGQMFRFVNDVHIGDLVLTPNTGDTVLIGKVTSDYQFTPGLFPVLRNPYGHPHTRKISWLREMARRDFSLAARKTLALRPTVINATEHAVEIRRLADIG